MMIKGKIKFNLSIVKRAWKEAQKSNVVRGRVGAVLFTNSGNMITSAHNSIMMGHGKNFTVHAERYLLAKIARMKIFKRFSGEKLNILVLRYKISSKYAALAKPCDECQFYLKEANVRIFYSDEKGFIQELNI